MLVSHESAKFAELNKEKPTVAGLLELAQEFTDWVVSTQGGKKQELFDLPNDIEVE